MLRAAVLSLILLATVAATLPAGEWLAEAALRNVAAQHTGTRRHSRAWWRRRRAHLRRRRTLAAEQRRRRWSLRTRPAEQSNATPRLPLPNTVSADELPDTLPSTLASITAIEQQVAPPAPSTATSLANTPAPSPAHAMPAPREAATTQPLAQTAARQVARLTAQPAHAVQAQPTSPALAHAPQQSLASDANAKAANSKGATASTPFATTNSAAPAAPAVRVAPVAPRLSTPRLTSPLGPVSTVLLPAPSPLARINDSAPALPAPLARVATPAPAPSLVGRDPHKFSALPVPHNWLGVSSTLGGEYKFSLRAADGRQSGVAVWSRVNLSTQGTLQGPVDRRNRAIAGVAHASLRRTVIDRMIVEGGWVVNDFERDIAGQKVFVVVAQSESNGQRRAWTYYFVELDGQLYSLATTAPSEFADSVASESEQTLTALASRHAATNSSQAGRSN